MFFSSVLMFGSSNVAIVFISSCDNLISTNYNSFPIERDTATSMPLYKSLTHHLIGKIKSILWGLENALTLDLIFYWILEKWYEEISKEARWLTYHERHWRILPRTSKTHLTSRKMKFILRPIKSNGMLLIWLWMCSRYFLWGDQSNISRK